MLGHSIPSENHMLKIKPLLFTGICIGVFVFVAATSSRAATPDFEEICPKGMGGLYTPANCTCMASKATDEEQDDMAYFFASLDDPTLTDLQKAGRGSAAVTKYGAACAT
jgi:hypothetical protein